MRSGTPRTLCARRSAVVASIAKRIASRYLQALVTHVLSTWESYTPSTVVLAINGLAQLQLQQLFDRTLDAHLLPKVRQLLVLSVPALTHVLLHPGVARVEV